MKCRVSACIPAPAAPPAKSCSLAELDLTGHTGLLHWLQIWQFSKLKFELKLRQVERLGLQRAALLGALQGQHQR